jgi:hypothetical protein
MVRGYKDCLTTFKKRKNERFFFSLHREACHLLDSKGRIHRSIEPSSATIIDWTCGLEPHSLHFSSARGLLQCRVCRTLVAGIRRKRRTSSSSAATCECQSERAGTTREREREGLGEREKSQSQEKLSRTGKRLLPRHFKAFP